MGGRRKHKQNRPASNDRRNDQRAADQANKDEIQDSKREMVALAKEYEEITAATDADQEPERKDVWEKRLALASFELSKDSLRLARRSLWSNWVIAAFAVVGAILVAAQAYLTRDASERAERPWVSVEAPTSKPNLSGNSGSIEIEATNSGHSPALYVKGLATIAIRGVQCPSNMIETLPPYIGSGRGIPIGPGKTVHLFLDYTIDSKSVAAIKGKAYIHLVGGLSYFDTFSDIEWTYPERWSHRLYHKLVGPIPEHLTTFMWVYNPDRGGGVGAWDTCRDVNEMK